MKQHPIDLLPDAIYERSQAGLRTGRVLSILGVIVAALVITATHSRMAVQAQQDRLVKASTKANEAFILEAQAGQLRQELAHIKQFTDLYDAVAHPLDISAIVATVINHLPSSVTLDQIDVSAAARQVRGSPRSKGTEISPSKKVVSVTSESPPPRQLIGELSGFAVSDDHIAELVRNLESMSLFSDVSLDYSRTRVVRGVSAREFRLSFRVNLDARYVIGGEISGEETLSPGLERTAHVNQ